MVFMKFRYGIPCHQHSRTDWCRCAAKDALVPPEIQYLASAWEACRGAS